MEDEAGTESEVAKSRRTEEAGVEEGVGTEAVEERSAMDLNLPANFLWADDESFECFIVERPELAAAPCVTNGSD